MELKEKVAYIKGMMEGMEFDTATKEGKLLGRRCGCAGGDGQGGAPTIDEDVSYAVR